MGDKSKAIAAMKIGQSVLLLTEKEANGVRSIIRRLGGRSISRKLRTGEGWRVWRVE